MSGKNNIGFLFDFDGVLADSHDLHWASWQLLQKEDPSFCMTQDQFFSGFGKRNELILKELAPVQSQAQHKKWAYRKEELFRQLAENQLGLLPGMAQFLTQVMQAGIPHIIASSTPVANLEMFLQKTDVGLYFTDFVSAEQVEHGKPAPDIFLAAAQKIEIPPKYCVVFEDAQVGIEAGKAAGCFVVALATTYPTDSLSGYDMIFPHPTALDLDSILKKRAKML
ncbi:MAG: HAD family phosphatase [Verrucomicrobia bacterium]|nr:HAD family phosphatase [Verrucomicrobiota bacterium]MBS0645109.1 HAD family phosphatase [Verrucomicrobiota bacterium]